MKRFLVPFAFVALLLLSGCGSGPTVPSGSTAGPKVDFVGNDSCPTSGQSPYNNGYAPATNGPAVGQAQPEMPHSHVNPPATVNYLHSPPTSGCHYSLSGNGVALSAPIQAGVYNQTVQTEYWVHNLEHGYVAVLYNCPKGCSTQFDQIHSWYKSLAPDPQLTSTCGSYAKVIVVPFSGMTPQFAVVSWDWYDAMPNGLDINEVQRFYANHTDQGPESPVC